MFSLSVITVRIQKIYCHFVKCALKKVQNKGCDMNYPHPGGAGGSGVGGWSVPGHKVKKHKHKDHKKHRRRSSSSSSSSSSSDSSSGKKMSKEMRKAHKEQRKLQKKMKKAAKKGTPGYDIPIHLMNSTARAPETREQWEARQSVVRRVMDPVTGRERLIRGDGEVLEEIVSRDRHREINRQATAADGQHFQANTIGWKLN